MKLALATLVGAAAALAACAEYYPPPPPPPLGAPPPAATALSPGQCFRTMEIRNHTIGDDRTLYIDVGGDRVYRVGMSGACLAGAVSSDPLVMRQPPGSSIVCRPLDLDISISKGGFTTPCIVQSIMLLTPEEVVALPPKIRP